MNNQSLKLPPVHTAILDHATLDQLFADLAQCASLRGVYPRVNPSQTPPPLPLSAAHRGIKDGTIPSLQIHYVHEGKTWCDTLIATADKHVRLVRISEDDIAPSH
jgi:hypothetical protein